MWIQFSHWYLLFRSLIFWSQFLHILTKLCAPNLQRCHIFQESRETPASLSQGERIHIHTCRQFPVFSQPELHVSGLSVETGAPAGDTHTHTHTHTKTQDRNTWTRFAIKCQRATSLLKSRLMQFFYHSTSTRHCDAPRPLSGDANYGTH